MSVEIGVFRIVTPPSARSLLPFDPGAPLLFLLIETTSKANVGADGGLCVNTVADAMTANRAPTVVLRMVYS